MTPRSLRVTRFGPLVLSLSIPPLDREDQHVAE
jgi:hypothetical protein